MLQDGPVYSKIPSEMQLQFKPNINPHDLSLRLTPVDGTGYQHIQTVQWTQGSEQYIRGSNSHIFYLIISTQPHSTK